MGTKRLNLSVDKVFENLMAYLKRHSDKFDVAEDATYGNTIVIADWNNKHGALEAFIGPFYTLKSIDTGHEDEYRRCDTCHKFICINQTASSDFVQTSHGDIWCEECAKGFIKEIIDDRKNREDMAWYQFLGTDYLTEAGFALCKNCDDKQSGMHPGMNDSPQGVIREFCEDNDLEHINEAYDYIFVVTSSNPFMVTYSMWVKEI